MLLFPDPRPLVERLGPAFFRDAPQSPGVYLMRDHLDQVLYVGKARNLKKRLASYRVANPDRLRRRHLKLLHSVNRIELRQCPTESAALLTESELIRGLRPRFNRAGTWPAPARCLAWQISTNGLALAVQTLNPDSARDPDGWQLSPPIGSSAFSLQSALARLFWIAAHPESGLCCLPQGWFHWHYSEPVVLSSTQALSPLFEQVAVRLRLFFQCQPDPLVSLLREFTSNLSHVFEIAVRDADLETLNELVRKLQTQAAS